MADYCRRSCSWSCGAVVCLFWSLCLIFLFEVFVMSVALPKRCFSCLFIMLEVGHIFSQRGFC